ncbi:MAG: iron-containing redox enzyme family protein [Burkholderiaceae bacterium]
MTTFHQRLISATDHDRQAMLGAPIIGRALRGAITIDDYLRFLHEAYHHVRHTVPLLQACRDALPQRLAWMAPALDEYVAEEVGHDEWILADIEAAGGDALAARHGRPSRATALMVAYAYDMIARVHPLGFLGMVHVLEGTSAALALQAADSIQNTLQLPANAMTYLRSHGHLDQEHTDHYAQLVNRLDDEADRQAIIDATGMFHLLYGNVFRSLDERDQPAGEPARLAA